MRNIEKMILKEFADVYTGRYNISYIHSPNLETIYMLHKTSKKTIIKQVARRFKDKIKMVTNCYYNSWSMGYRWRVDFKEIKDIFTENELYDLSREEYERLYLIEMNYQEVINKNDDLKYCAYVSNRYINFLDYVKIYKKYPVAELLMKLNLQRMINEKALKIITSNKTFRKYLFENKDKINGESFTRVYNAFKKNQEFISYSNSLNYRIELGKNLSAIRKDVYSKILKKFNQEKINNYLEKNKIDINSYNDYLIAANFLQQDLQNPLIVFTKDFWHYHDLYCEEYHKHILEKELEESNTLNFKLYETTNKYFDLINYVDKENKYIIKLARTKTDLINEGSKLNHCLGKMGYDEKILKEESLIFFVRIKEDKETPYLTIEFDLNKKQIIQKYGMNNKIIPETDKFVLGWEKYAKNILKEIKL